MYIIYIFLHTHTALQLSHSNEDDHSFSSSTAASCASASLLPVILLMCCESNVLYQNVTFSIKICVHNLDFLGTKSPSFNTNMIAFAPCVVLTYILCWVACLLFLTKCDEMNVYAMYLWHHLFPYCRKVFGDRSWERAKPLLFQKDWFLADEIGFISDCGRIYCIRISSYFISHFKSFNYYLKLAFLSLWQNVNQSVHYLEPANSCRYFHAIYTFIHT